MSRRTSTAREILGALAAGCVVTFCYFVLLWHNPLLFWNDDYQLSILPVFADVARSWSEGHLPLLSPYSWVCSNLAGEFQYGTFSVFINAAVVVIWKFPLTFPQQAAALSMVHLFALAMGGYMLARGRELAAPLALMVALVAALNGWIVCWGATDWFGALGAFAWLPWAWWGLERAADPARGRWRFVYPAPFVYLLVTGGFPYTVVMLALIASWVTLRTFVQRRSIAACVPVAFGTAVGFGIAAPAWLALFSYVHGSAREAQDAASHLQWLVPPAALPAFILPAWTVKWADFSTRLMPHTAVEMACGVVAPAALLAGFVARGKLLVRRIAWDLALLGVVLILAMSPTANVFRWSFRWLPLLHLVMAICAAEALQLMNANGRPQQSHQRVPAITLLLVLGTSAAMWLFRLQGQYGTVFAITMATIASLWLVLELFSRSPAIEQRLIPAFAGLSLLATYLCIPANVGVPRYDLPQDLTGAAPLDPARLYLSVYPAPENFYRIGKKDRAVGTVVRLGSTSMWGGVRLINGYSPIRPAGVARRYNFGIHGEIDYAIAERLLASESGPDGELARLGVDGIIVASEFALRPQPDNEWQAAHSSAEGSVYHRVAAPLTSIRSIAAEENRTYSAAAVTAIRDYRNSVAAHIDVPSGGLPALVVFSRPFFSGYRASLNNQALPVTSFRGLAPAVELPAGSSGELVLRYIPAWLTTGTVIAAISVALLIAGTVGQLNRPRRDSAG